MFPPLFVLLGVYASYSLVGMVGNDRFPCLYPCKEIFYFGWIVDCYQQMVRCAAWLIIVSIFSLLSTSFYSCLFYTLCLLPQKPIDLVYLFFYINPFSSYHLAKQLSFQKAVINVDIITGSSLVGIFMLISLNCLKLTLLDSPSHCRQEIIACACYWNLFCWIKLLQKFWHNSLKLPILWGGKLAY